MPRRRPNVVVFFTDQQRHDTTGVHGCPLGLTPNFDRLAAQGTHVALSFSCQPVCGPSRASLQTGLYGTRSGVWGNGLPLRRGVPLLAREFGAAGYHTGYIGKWHLAPGPDIVGPVPRALRGGYQSWLASNVLEFTSDAFETHVWDEHNREHRLPGYRVDALTDAAIRHIDTRARSARPFFLFLSFIEPHHQNHRDSYPAPPGYEERYAGRWLPPDLQAHPGSSAAHWPGYCGMVRRLDEAFGRLVDALRSLDLLEETVILFTSDHGCHFKTRNSEYKRSCHDASIRVPTLLAGPGFEGGGRVRELVSLVDLPPTLLAAAGLRIPAAMQGRSLLPLLRGGGGPDWPREVFVQISESQTGRAIRTPRWKYSVMSPETDVRGYPVSRAGADTYVEDCLYDLDSDPWEQTNLIGLDAFRNVATSLQRRLVARMIAAGEKRPRIVSAPVRPAHQRRPKLEF